MVVLPVAPVRRRRAARHRSSASRSTASSSSATPSPSRCWPRSTPSPAAGTCRACARDHLVRRDVERGDQAGPARPSAGHAPRRRLRLVGGVGMGTSVSRAPSRPPRRPSSSRARRPRWSTRTAGTSSPARARSACSPSAAASRSATTRTRKVRGHLPGHRRRPLLGPRRLRQGRRRRHACTCSAVARLHQHRRREGLPRGGRGGAQGHPACATPWWSASPTSGSASASARWSSWSPRPTRPAWKSCRRTSAPTSPAWRRQGDQGTTPQCCGAAIRARWQRIPRRR